MDFQNKNTKRDKKMNINNSASFRSETKKKIFIKNLLKILTKFARKIIFLNYFCSRSEKNVEMPTNRD